jgi:hypothetical protein
MTSIQSEMTNVIDLESPVAQRLKSTLLKDLTFKKG